MDIFYANLVEKVKEWCNMSNSFLVHVWIGFCLLFLINIFLYIVFTLFRANRTEYVESRDDCQLQLLQAIDCNNTAEAIAIVNMRPELINKPIRNGFTPFMIVCSQGKTQLIKFMINHGADVNKKTPQNDPIFYLAVFYFVLNPGETNATSIRELFYAGCDINEPNSKGYTPLQMAAMFGHTALVKWLLSKNASSNVNPHPAVIARSQGHQETADLIIEWESNRQKAIEGSRR